MLLGQSNRLPKLNRLTHSRRHPAEAPAPLSPAGCPTTTPSDHPPLESSVTTTPGRTAGLPSGPAPSQSCSPETTASSGGPAPVCTWDEPWCLPAPLNSAAATMSSRSVTDMQLAGWGESAQVYLRTEVSNHEISDVLHQTKAHKSSGLLKPRGRATPVEPSKGPSATSPLAAKPRRHLSKDLGCCPREV